MVVVGLKQSRSFLGRPFSGRRCQGFPLHVFAASGAEALGEGWQGRDALGDLHGLLTEVQALRAQLERSIGTSRALQSKLEEQLAKAGRKAPEAALASALQTLPAAERPLGLDRHGTAPRPSTLRECSPVRPWDMWAFERRLALGGVFSSTADMLYPGSQGTWLLISCHLWQNGIISVWGLLILREVECGLPAALWSCSSHPFSPAHITPLLKTLFSPSYCFQKRI